MEKKPKGTLYTVVVILLIALTIFSCHGGNDKSDKQKCKACHGSGYYEHKMCPFCNGTGYSDWDPYKYVDQQEVCL